MVIFQKWIMREDLNANPDVWYLFGDNSERKGYGGQAKEMRGEPNSIGIPTKYRPTTGKDAYFTDERLQFQKNVLDVNFWPALMALCKDQLVVIPTDGLGTGLSKLPQKAPLTNLYLEGWIRELSLFDGAQRLLRYRPEHIYQEERQGGLSHHEAALEAVERLRKEFWFNAGR